MAALLFALGLSACQETRQEVEQDVNRYFPLAETVQDQVKLLSIEGADLLKIVMLVEEKKTDSLLLESPDTAAWARELSWFEEADINEPALRDLFSISETKQGDNLLVKRYERKSRSAAGVQYIEAHYEPVLDELKTLEILYMETNTMYDARRLMRMHFGTDDTGELWLRSFSIDGHQSIIFQQDEHFIVEGRVRFPEAVKLH